ncbi:MAG: hypothetical protein KU38_01325 [Sulfurovum sp. FS08-3]|nr:MAG: hypothetical protein KU38_01325 [Sulfurovum sp. FS08-3]
MQKLFLDANIILDLIDAKRDRVAITKERLTTHLANGDRLYTSCDIFTTVYYVAAKHNEFSKVIAQLEAIASFVEIIPIDANIIHEAIRVSKASEHKDLEDILQYICAKEMVCDLILSNDKGFYAPDIELQRVV